VSTFQTESELYEVLGTFLQQTVADESLAAKFASAGVTVLITYTDPDSRIFLDCTQNPPQVTPGVAPATNADFRLTMRADDGHTFWLGKFNIPLALAKRQVRVEGPLSTMMKLLPAIQSAFPRYGAFLKANGKAHLLA